MASLTVWDNFSKRKNSTLRPTGGASVDVNLKENTSLEKPIFIVRGLANANYCQFMNNYYFVDDVVFVTNEIVELYCTMDALATNRDAIANYTCFVERSASQYDVWIDDNELKPKRTGVYSTPTEQSLSDMIDTTGGRYVVRVLGRNCVQGFVMTQERAEELLNYTNEYENFDDVFLGLDAIVDGAVKGLFNPDKFIVSCKWFPLREACMDLGSSEVIWLGNWNTHMRESRINTPKVVINKTISLPLPIYPDDFRKYDSEFTVVKIFLPCIGTVAIDPNKYPNGIGVKYISDLYSGGLTVLLADADSNAPIQEFHGTIGIDVPLGRSYQNTLGLASAIINGTPTNVTTPDVSMIGGTGSIATIQAIPNIRISVYGYNSCDLVGTLGRPLMQMKRLGDLHGFVKCKGASLPSIAYGKEKDSINNYLNNGFYME